MREAHQQASRRAGGPGREPSAPFECSQPCRQSFLQLGVGMGKGPAEAGMVERRVRHHAQSQRNDSGEILTDPQCNRMHIGARVVRGSGRPEQALEVRPGRAHRGEEQVILAAEALVQDRLGDAGGLGDFAGGRRVAADAKAVAGHAKHLLVGDGFQSSHEAQCKRRNARLTNKRALANLFRFARSPCLSRRVVMLCSWIRSAFVWTGALVVVAAGPLLSADDAKDKPAASGTWLKKDGELRLEFADKDVLKIAPHGDKAPLVIVCSYTIAKDGTVKAKVTDIEASDEIKEKVKGKISVGLEMTFAWKVKDDLATIDDLKGENTEIFKSHMEGEFARKRSD